MNPVLRARALALALLLGIPIAATGCLPHRLSTDVRFSSCSMPVFDSATGNARSALRPYLDEVSSITGMQFRWVGTQDAARFGLIVAPMPSAAASNIVGSYAQTYEGAGSNGEPIVAGSVIRLRPYASAGIRRHEIGHLFNLAHNDASTLMRPAPGSESTYSEAERMDMRAMAGRSGCGPSAKVEPAPTSDLGSIPRPVAVMIPKR